MPRSCSSGSRSVSLPVSARTSHVLPWSMWPAVPTVSGTGGAALRPRPVRGTTAGIIRRRGRADGLGGLVHFGVGQRAAVQEEPAVADDAEDRRVAGAERRGELLGRARTRSSGARRAAARRRRRGRPSPRPRRPSARRGARRAPAPPRPARASIRRTGTRARGRAQRGQRPLERGQGELVGAQGALERMAAQPLDEVGATGDDAGLGPAEELVARERRRGARPPRCSRARIGSSPRAARARPSRGRPRAPRRGARPAGRARAATAARRSRRCGSWTGGREEPRPSASPIARS